ncbi:6-bladed beta-propeller [Bacteroides sp.]|uniref:6-bladed beta-propeller n=1 Tax=Bacteroides sp. TaxID=29523 RepID=UPI002FC8887C
MKNLFLFFILWIVVACGSNSQKAKEDDSSSKEDRLGGKETVVPVLDLQKEYPKKDIILQDFAEVKYIAFETNDSVLLSDYTMHLIDDVIITHDESENILFFDKEGKFLHSFNRIGGSGEEYGQYLDVICDTIAKEIFILDRFAFRIQVYDPNGVYKRTLKLPYEKIQFASVIFEYDKDFLFAENILDADQRDEAPPKNKKPYYKISKKDGKLTSLPIISNERIRDRVNFSEGDNFIAAGFLMPPVARFGSDILIADYSWDTVYTYRNDHLTPIAVRQNHVSKSNFPIIATIDMISDRYLLWCAVEKNIDVEALSGPDPIKYLSDRLTGESWQVEITNNDGVSAQDARKIRKRMSGNLHVLPRGYVLQAYPADFLMELNEAGKLKGKLKTIASKLSEEDNPVLMIAKFKE